MSDKRSVATDALETLGFIISDKEKRDAIHLAVEPAVAAHTLQPGSHVGFHIDGGFGNCDDPVGIVDPFLRSVVRKGERFWLVVYPRQIASLRHVWTHPKFPEDSALVNASHSERFIREFALSIGVGYDELMEHARDYVYSGNYWCEGGRFEGQLLPEGFWTHYETVTGKAPDEDSRWSFFSCSC